MRTTFVASENLIKRLAAVFRALEDSDRKVLGGACPLFQKEWHRKSFQPKSAQFLLKFLLEYIDFGALAGRSRSRIWTNFYYKFNWEFKISELWPAGVGSSEFLLQF